MMRALGESAFLQLQNRQIVEFRVLETEDLTQDDVRILRILLRIPDQFDDPLARSTGVDPIHGHFHHEQVGRFEFGAGLLEDSVRHEVFPPVGHGFGHVAVGVEVLGVGFEGALPDGSCLGGIGGDVMRLTEFHGGHDITVAAVEPLLQAGDGVGIAFEFGQAGDHAIEDRIIGWILPVEPFENGECGLVLAGFHVAQGHGVFDLCRLGLEAARQEKNQQEEQRTGADHLKFNI